MKAHDTTLQKITTGLKSSDNVLLLLQLLLGLLATFQPSGYFFVVS